VYVCVCPRQIPAQRRSLKSTRDLDSCVYIIFYDLRRENLMPLNRRGIYECENISNKFMRLCELL